MAKLYGYVKGNGEVVRGLPLEAVLKLKQEDEAAEKASRETMQSEAQLGPQVAAGIRAYDSAKKDVREFSEKEAGTDTPSPELMDTLSGLGGATQGQQPSQVPREQIGAAQQPPMPSGEGQSLSTMGGGQDFQAIAEARQAKERTMSAPMTELMKDLPPEIVEDLIAEFRMKPDATKFYNKLLKMNADQLEFQKNKEKAAYESENKINESSSVQKAMDSRQTQELEYKKGADQLSSETQLKVMNGYANAKSGGTGSTAKNTNLDDLYKSRNDMIKNFVGSDLSEVQKTDMLNDINSKIAQETKRAGYRDSPTIPRTVVEQLSRINAFIAEQKDAKGKARQPKKVEAANAALEKIKAEYGMSF